MVIFNQLYQRSGNIRRSSLIIILLLEFWAPALNAQEGSSLQGTLRLGGGMAFGVGPAIEVGGSVEYHGAILSSHLLSGSEISFHSGGESLTFIRVQPGYRLRQGLSFQTLSAFFAHGSFDLDRFPERLARSGVGASVEWGKLMSRSAGYSFMLSGLLVERSVLIALTMGWVILP